MSHNPLQISAGRILAPAHKGMSRAYAPMFSALLVLAIIGAHLRLHIYGGGAIIVPAYLYLLAIAGFAVMHFNAVVTRVLPYTLGIWVLVFAVAGLKADGADLMTVLNPTVQFTVSISAAAILIIALNNASPSMARRTVTILWLSIIILAVLERIALREIFEQIKLVLYSGSGRGNYSSLARDIQIYGASRSTVMASEPSFLAYTLSILSIMRFILDENPSKARRLSSLIGMFVINYVVAPSLSMSFFLIAALVWSSWPKHYHHVIYFIITAIFAFAVLGMLAANFNFNLPSNIRTHMESGSFMGRILIGPLVGMKILAEHPIFGLGLGNDSAAYPYIVQEWSSQGGFSRFPWFSGLRATDLISNGFWWQWIYLGAAGCITIFTLVGAMLKRIGVATPFRAIFCSWIVWYAGGAFVDPFSWLVVAVFALTPRTPLLLPAAIRPATRQEHSPTALPSAN